MRGRRVAGTPIDHVVPGVRLLRFQLGHERLRLVPRLVLADISIQDRDPLRDLGDVEEVPLLQVELVIPRLVFEEGLEGDDREVVGVGGLVTLPRARP
jgi:hypothetical protein